MATIAVFLALGGGAYAAVSSIPGSDGVIHSCYGKNGSLRVVRAGKKCGKGEKAIAFNQTGRKGSPGAQGVPGTPGGTGANGGQGPQGPGATSFSTTLEQKSGLVVLTTLDNGITVLGRCGTQVELVLTSKVGMLASGTAGYDVNVAQVGVTGGHEQNVLGNTYVDLDVIAREIGTFARIDVHGTFGRDVHGTYGPTCAFWGMITPSS
jgi:hypothetical protein